jgi:hypothetical protein
MLLVFFTDCLRNLNLDVIDNVQRQNTGFPIAYQNVESRALATGDSANGCGCGQTMEILTNLVLVVHSLEVE